MPLTLYGLKTCDTCTKARKALLQAGHDVCLVDIRTGADLANLVPYWLKTSGEAALVNKRSTTWRTLSPAQRGQDPAALLIKHPTLIKRPVIIAADTVHVGWTKATQEALCATPQTPPPAS